MIDFGHHPIYARVHQSTQLIGIHSPDELSLTDMLTRPHYGTSTDPRVLLQRHTNAFRLAHGNELKVALIGRKAGSLNDPLMRNQAVRTDRLHAGGVAGFERHVS
jgi:hypothetical protein